jgi:queuine tRNA-ribosyltransferase catalytic subunit
MCVCMYAVLVQCTQHGMNETLLPCADDTQPIDATCPCEVCQQYSRAAVHAALCHNTAAGATLVSIHNVAYTQNLTCAIRQAINKGEFEGFVKDFMRAQFTEVPEWIQNALQSVGITLDS